MTEDRTPRASDEPNAVTKQRKKRKWDQPAEDMFSAVAAAAAVAGLTVLNIGALSGVQLPGTTAAPSPNVVPAPYALPPQLAPSVLQSAAAAVQKLSQAKMPDELIAREVVINDADPSVRYKLTKRQTQDEIQRCTCTVIITRGKYHPPNGQPDGEKPLYLHISAGSQLKDTAERIKAVDRAASMIEETLKQGQEGTSAPFPSSQSNFQAFHPFSASIFLGFDADPSLNVAARIRGPNLSLASQSGWEKLLSAAGASDLFTQDQYINHIMNETGVTVVLRGKDSGNLGNCHTDAASQQPLHLYLSSVHLKSLEAAKVLVENLLDTIAAEFGASRISTLKVYGAVPPPQQLLAGVHTSGTTSDIHSTLGPYVTTGASHSFAPTGVTAPIVASSVTLQSAPTYSGARPSTNLICPSQAANAGAFYNGYGDIYPQATPLQQVALTPKHASSSTAQFVPVASTSTSMTAEVNSSAKLESDKRSQRRKFQELPTAELQNSQQGSKFVETGLDDLGKMSSSSVAPKRKVQPGSNGMLPQDSRHMPSRLSVSTSMPPPSSKSMSPPSSKNMPPPPSSSMPPPPPKFPSNEVLSRNENRRSALKEPMVPLRSLDMSSVSPPKFWSAQLPLKDPREEKPSSASVSDTLLKLMDYGADDDDDGIDEKDSVPRGDPTPSSGQKPFWAV